MNSHMNNLNKKDNLSLTYLILAITVIIYVLLTVSSSMFLIENAELSINNSIITKQEEIEHGFKTNGYTLENPKIILNPYGNSPLTALVMFETTEEVIPEIIIKGKDEFSTYEGIGNLGTKHYLPIYGLYADKKNEVVISVNDIETILIIETDPLPEDIAIPVNVKVDKANLVNDLYFFTPSSGGYTSAYDVNGDIRWYLTDKMAWDISRLNNGRLLLSTERPINPPYYTTGLYEIDLLGKIYTEYSLPGGYHHDFYELKNGNLLVASDDFDSKEGTVEDYIVELERNSGQIIKTWDLKNVLNMEDGKSENWIDYDWFHNNSVWYDEKENVIILSGRHQDAVIAIDYDTSELKWIIGDPTGWSDEYQDYFFTPINDNGNIVQDKDEFEWQWSQHAAMVTPEGYVFILDNGNNKSKIEDEYVPAEESYTRGVIYEINTSNMTIKQLWQYGRERGHEFYSPYISDVDYLGENHYLVHSGGIVYVDGKISNRPAGFDKNAEMYSTTVELLNNEVIFELTLPSNMYRAEKMNPYNHSQFEIGGQRRLGSLGGTSHKEYNLNLKEFYSYKKALNIDEYEEYNNINLINEEDRLVLKGSFDKYKETSLLLVKGRNVKEYEMRISKKPYTALCIDLFTPNETDNTLEIEKYVNKKSLKGSYQIFLKIDNVLYNTNYSIDIDERR